MKNSVNRTYKVYCSDIDTGLTIVEGSDEEAREAAEAHRDLFPKWIGFNGTITVELNEIALGNELAETIRQKDQMESDLNKISLALQQAKKIIIDQDGQLNTRENTIAGYAKELREAREPSWSSFKGMALKVISLKLLLKSKGVK